MAAVLDNVTIGILTKVNELASRYRLEPTDFIAETKMEEAPDPKMGGLMSGTGRTILEYTTPPSDPSKMERFEQMLDSLGINDGALIATDSEIIKALNHALEIAPRARPRI